MNNSFIKSLMDEKKLKQKDLAVILGISSAAVSQWNEDGTNISIDCLFSLSKLFHVTVDEILAGKKINESLEDKWKRDYDINEELARAALIDGEKEKVLKYFSALQKANVKFFELFEKRVVGNISDDEQKEWEYLGQFFDVNMYRSDLLNNIQVSRIDSVSEMILNTLIEKLGRDKNKAIVWELQKIYHTKNFGVGITEDIEIVPIDDYFDDYGDEPLKDIKEDEDIFFVVYDILSPIEKDKFVTSEFHNRKKAEYIYKLLKHGGNILYMPSDLNLINYDYKDLDELEGEKIPVHELDDAQAFIFERYDNYSVATYEQYRTLINYPRMRQIKMEAKYKERNPIEYWEYFKNNGVVI